MEATSNSGANASTGNSKYLASRESHADAREFRKTLSMTIWAVLFTIKAICGILVVFLWYGYFTGDYSYSTSMITGGTNLYLVCIFSLLVAVVANILNITSEEMHAIISLLQLLYAVRTTQRRLSNNKQKFSVADSFEARVDQQRDFVQIITVEDGSKHSLDSLEKTANMVAQWGISERIQTTSATVGLLMLNRPEHVATWLGLAKIGCSTAMLNTNISGSSLIHCIDISLKKSEKKIVIVDDDIYSKSMTPEDKNSIQELGIRLVLWKELLKASASLGHERPPKEMRANMGPKDTLMYIFTSGTTGKPKASRISHVRYETACFPYQKMCNLDGKVDRVYCALPLYHSSAGMMGFGACMNHGITMVLRKKFSVNRFAEDCFTFNCTSFQYIGELCRFLVSIPPGEYDSYLNLKTAYGNGLGADVWEAFRKRYGVGRICEFYASTEGNVAMFNPSGRVGRLGYIPPIFERFYSVKIVKMDPDDPSTPLRNKITGFLSECKYDEPGLVIAKISASQEFDGYSEARDTDKKKLFACFCANDVYYNTGDTMRKSREGYYTWEDRVGDTFRWKGENVATTEVTACISNASKSVADCAVYGVAIEGYDGKAGMAAVQPSEMGGTVNLDELAAAMKKDLPVYACPVFFRLVDALPLTSTFKHKKTQLANEGWKSGKNGVGNDKVYLYDSKSGKFSVMTSELEAGVISKTIRL